MKVCYINKPQLIERSNKIEYILSKYFDAITECIEENPKDFKEALALAVSDPKELAKAYTLQMKQSLSTKPDEYIDWMFQEVKKEEE
jgi:predicted TIM-barrel fold metal-dependent hydrolase